MTLGKLEWLRVSRTKRWLALVGAYVVFGCMGPISARYIKEIISLAGGSTNGMTITVPDPVPADGMIQYVSNAVQLGTIIAVVVAAGALAFDAIPEMGVFLRTRVPSVGRILAPRVVVPFLVAAGAWILGALTAWYETQVLLGSLPVGRVLLGIGLGILFLAFVIAIVAAAAQWARGVIGTVMTSIVVLLVLPMIGIVDVIGRWLPTRLGSALAELPGGTPIGEYLGPTGVALVAIPALLWLAVRGAKRREV
jgi:ABC-2 type transport system permease protein